MDPFNGMSNFFRLTDVMHNWVAGYTVPWDGHAQGYVLVTRWSDDQIVIGGFSHSNPWNGDGSRFVLNVGDTLTFEVANPQEQGLVSPDNRAFQGSPVAKCSASVVE